MGSGVIHFNVSLIVTGTVTRRTVFSSMLLYVHRDHKDYYGRGAQDGHVDLHTVQSWALEKTVSMNHNC